MNIQKIYVENAVIDEALTRQILQRNSQAKIINIERYKELPKAEIADTDLVLINYRGRFLEKCPGTKDHICCNYYIINWAIGCPYNCTYCYLHGYKNFPGIIVHANTSQIIFEVKEMADKNPDRQIRIGTGEFTDSIALEQATGFNSLILPELLKIDNVVVELKTKCGDLFELKAESSKLKAQSSKAAAAPPQILRSAAQNDAAVRNARERSLSTKDLKTYRLNDLKTKNPTTNHQPLSTNLIFAWSVNPPEIIASDEIGAATLPDRLKAAQQCQQAGYQVSLHLDPIICYEGWETGYKQTIDEIFKYLDPNGIAWISMGALRFNPKVKKAALQKFPQTRIYYGELLPGIDGKLRYFRPLRVVMFKQVYSWLREYAPKTAIYLCMESPEVWREVFGSTVSFGGELRSLFG
ncbi:radical SAM protein [Candidatus Margulisiibacteriota bacterium]